MIVLVYSKVANKTTVLNIVMFEAIPALHYFMSSTTQDMLDIPDVK